MTELQNSEAPPDSSADQQQTPAPDSAQVVELRAELAESRAKFADAVSSRDKAKARNRELEASKPDTGNPAPADDTPQWALDLKTQVEGFGEKLEANKRDGARTKTLEAVLAGVPEPNRKAVELMVGGLEAGGLDLADPGAAAKITAQLSENPTLFVDHSRGTPRRTPQVGPDGKASFVGMTIDEIGGLPQELRQQAFNDPETLARLTAEVGGGSTRGVDGLNI